MLVPSVDAMFCRNGGGERVPLLENGEGDSEETGAVCSLLDEAELAASSCVLLPPPRIQLNPKLFQNPPRRFLLVSGLCT